MTALLTADEAARLTLGVNVIVRPGDEMEDWHGEDGLTFVAPTQWADLEGVCDRCGGYPLTGVNKSNWHKGVSCCSECRDGRRIVPLYRECPHVRPRDLFPHHSCGDCQDGRVLVGRGNIEVVPVVIYDDWQVDGNPVPCVTIDSWGNAVHMHTRMDDGAQGLAIALDRIPVPGKDWGVIIDVVELVTP